MIATFEKALKKDPPKWRPRWKCWYFIRPRAKARKWRSSWPQKWPYIPCNNQYFKIRQPAIGQNFEPSLPQTPSLYKYNSLRPSYTTSIAWKALPVIRRPLVGQGVWMFLPNHLILKKTKVYRSWLIGFLGWAGVPAERLGLLVCRTHAPGKSLFLLQVPANNHFFAFRAPPGLFHVHASFISWKSPFSLL